MIKDTGWNFLGKGGETPKDDSFLQGASSVSRQILPKKKRIKPMLWIPLSKLKGKGIRFKIKP